MYKQDENTTEAEKRKFWNALLTLKMKYKTWDDLALSLEINRQTLDNWREPNEGMPNLKGKLPPRITVNGIIKMAEEFQKEIRERYLDGDINEPSC